MEELFRRHWPNTHRAAYLIVRDAAAAEDIAQEAFLSALSALGRFDRRRPFAPWLHRIAVNRAIDWSRARALRGEVAASGELLDAVGRGPGRRRGSRRGERGRRRARAGSRAEHRAVVVLRYLLDYTPGEIAHMLDLPRGTSTRACAGRSTASPSCSGRRDDERGAPARGAARRAGSRRGGRREERALTLVRAAYSLGAAGAAAPRCRAPARAPGRGRARPDRRR